MGRARRRRERVLEHLTELRRLPIGGAPEPAFRTRLRAELLSGASAAEQARPPGDQAHPAAPKHARPRRARRRPLLSHLATFGLATAMMVSAFATYQAVPGDSLYPLKRAAESTLVRLSSDDAERGERELDSAKTRAKEVATLLGSSDDGPLVSETLTEMEKSTRSGISRLERAEPRSPKIKKFARDQKEVVGPMLSQLSEDHQAQAEDYLHYIEGLAAPG
ncbi:hypothetical protein EDD27_9451 [Nonomuraea polychroma]|uniref:DUF5667 domain-containing protein n=1 Tax=Nonomuraea polychroma TaxID=46176 RepID=A0A438MLN5_9ACTN|nr:DUF5667 domain-containing protein [Nonomuraea polychroma]RVX46561.1 hypothetical protein EDD27_9451 [Nonomuraea polychroma]